jgi:delta(3,5)-delta(2,4)-dienoyl-CoA isomerase
LISGFAADVGVLQYFPKLINNQSLMRELCFTARKIPSDEAEKFGLVSRVFEDKEP